MTRSWNTWVIVSRLDSEGARQASFRSRSQWGLTSISFPHVTRVTSIQFWLLMLKGASTGTDNEVRKAEQMGLPKYNQRHLLDGNVKGQ